jgi:hypothetical protein
MLHHERSIKRRGAGISMISPRVCIAFALAVVVPFASLGIAPSFGGSSESQIVSRELRSEHFAHNKIGTSTARKLAWFSVALHPVGTGSGVQIMYPRPNWKLIEMVFNGWPHILASAKSLLETGEALEGTRLRPKGF